MHLKQDEVGRSLLTNKNYNFDFNNVAKKVATLSHFLSNAVQTFPLCLLILKY